MANKDQALSFEDFIVERDNFHLHFYGESGECVVADIYRRRPAYVKCMQAIPETLGGITRELKVRTDIGSLDYQRRAYRAYVFMYQFARSNAELFL